MAGAKSISQRGHLRACARARSRNDRFAAAARGRASQGRAEVEAALAAAARHCVQSKLNVGRNFKSGRPKDWTKRLARVHNLAGQPASQRAQEEEEEVQIFRCDATHKLAADVAQLDHLP